VVAADEAVLAQRRNPDCDVAPIAGNGTSKSAISSPPRDAAWWPRPLGQIADMTALRVEVDISELIRQGPQEMPCTIMPDAYKSVAIAVTSCGSIRELFSHRSGQSSHDDPDDRLRVEGSAGFVSLRSPRQ
jgi:hypothetical protein